MHLKKKGCHKVNLRRCKLTRGTDSDLIGQSGKAGYLKKSLLAAFVGHSAT